MYDDVMHFYRIESDRKPNLRGTTARMRLIYLSIPVVLISSIAIRTFLTIQCN